MPKLKAPSINPNIGDLAMRYPAGDPENGPAYPQVLTASGWECREHVWNFGGCVHCGADDPGLNWRKQKRYERRHGDGPVYDAYLSGQCGYVRHYPPGRRRDEYERGRQHTHGVGTCPISKAYGRS